MFRTSQLSSFAPQPPLDEAWNQGRHQRDREDGHADHGKALGEGQRMEVLALLPGQGKHGNERQENNNDRKEDRPTMRQAGMIISRVSPVILWWWPKWAVNSCVAFSTITIAWSTRMPMEMAMPDKRHDVRGNVEVPHENKRHQHRQRQGHADHHRAAKVHQDQQNRQRGDDHLVAKRAGDGLDGPVDGRVRS